MATESVSIVISAQDEASKVLEETAKRVKALNAETRETANTFKSTGDIISKAARALGGGWIVDAANGAKDVADGWQKANEVLRSTSKLASLAKAGLIVGVFAGAVAIGKAIGDWVYGVEGFRKELAKAADEQARLAAEANKTLGKQGSSELADIKEFGTEADRDAFLKKNELELAGVKARAAAEEALAKQIESAWFKNRRFSQDDIANAQAKADASKAQLEILRRQREEALGMFSEAEKEREAVRSAMASAKAEAESDVARKEQEFQKQKEDSLKKQIEAEKQIVEERKKAFQVMQEDAAWRQRVQAERGEDRSRSLIEDLQAARAKKVDTSSTSLQATEGRLLSRNTTAQDTQRQMLDLQRKSVEEQKAAKALFQNMVGDLRTIAGNLGIPPQVWGNN